MLTMLLLFRTLIVYLVYLANRALRFEISGITVASIAPSFEHDFVGVVEGSVIFHS